MVYFFEKHKKIDIFAKVMCKSEGLAFRSRFVLEFAQALNLKYIININSKHVLK